MGRQGEGTGMPSASPCLPVSRSPCLFFLGGVAVGAAVGWAAANCHLGGWAPVGLVSLAVGVVLGLVIAQLAKKSGVSGRRLVAGTAIFALIAILAEHAWLYRDFRRQWVEARAGDPQVALFRPERPWSPTEYFRREMSPGRAALWCVDAVLVVASALGVVWMCGKANPSTFVVADDANYP